MSTSMDSAARQASILAREGFHLRAPLPVIALHCSGSGPFQWRSWQAAASGRGEIIAPALLGYARPADWDEAGLVDLAAEAAALAPLLSDCPDGVHLLGHSYGGAVALELALRYPAKIRSLTLYEPVRFSLLRAHGDAEWHDILAVASTMVALARAGSRDESSRHFVDYWSGAGSWTRLPEPARAALQLRATKMCAEFDALFADDVSPDRFRQLAMPVRLLSGLQSPQPALRVVDRLAELVPDAQRIRLPGLGHMGPLQDPVRVMEATGLFAPMTATA
jgi:pimeloyl-ACP methyl ester carboxylesterase